MRSIFGLVGVHDIPILGGTGYAELLAEEDHEQEDRRCGEAHECRRNETVLVAEVDEPGGDSDRRWESVNGLGGKHGEGRGRRETVQGLG